MEMSAEDAVRSAVKKYYHNLLELLPISKLAEHLFSRKLLSFDWKSELDKLSSPKEKTSGWDTCSRFKDSLAWPDRFFPFLFVVAEKGLVNYR